MARRKRHCGPLDFTNPLDVSTVDLTAVATTEYSSGLIDIEEFFIFTAIIDIIETTTTPATGEMTLRLEVLKKDKSTVLWQDDLITVIDTSNDGQQEVLVFGAGASGKLHSASSGTISADIDCFKTAQYIRLVLVVDVQADGDTAANVNLLMEG